VHFIFGKPLSIEDINGTYIPESDIRKIRAAQKILVIDDQDFLYKQQLVENYDFRITKLDDLENSSHANEYNIVLCDIDGVGKKIGGEKGSGGDIIKELRKSYPLKTILAYSGHSYSARYNKYFELADKVVEKDIELDEWVELLDNYCEEIINPVLQWKKTRNHLLECNLRLEIILELEDLFVKSYKDRNKLEEIVNNKLVKNLDSTAKAIISGLIVNVITGLVTS